MRLRIAAATQVDEERRMAESRGQGSKSTASEKNPDPQLSTVETEVPEDLLPLRQRKRKATADPVETLVIGISEGDAQPISPNQGRQSNTSSPLILNTNNQEARGNIFTDLGSPLGAQLLTGMLTSEENAHLRGLRSTQKLYEKVARALSVSTFLLPLNLYIFV